MFALTALILLIAVLAAVYGMVMVRRRPQTPVPGGVLEHSDRLSPNWIQDAGADLGDLNEPARCDLIFAASQLGDERSHQMLVHALADPSPTVSLAAAHALARNGHIRDVQEYARNAHSERSKELLELLALID